LPAGLGCLLGPVPFGEILSALPIRLAEYTALIFEDFAASDSASNDMAPGNGSINSELIYFSVV
jgi:hypothetical protein